MRAPPIPGCFAKSNKQASVPAYLGHVRMQNGSNVAIDTRLTPASGGTAEHEAALEMLRELPGEQRKTVGADKNLRIFGLIPMLLSSGGRRRDAAAARRGRGRRPLELHRAHPARAAGDT